jgi:hypothetical protein
MSIEIINQVGLEVAATIGEPYGCKVTAFEVQRYDGDALCFTLTLVGDHKAGIMTCKIPILLANCLAHADDLQSRLDLAGILQKRLQHFAHT